MDFRHNLTPNFLNEKQLRDFSLLLWYYWLSCLLKIKMNTFQIFLVVMSMLIKVRFVWGEFFSHNSPTLFFFSNEHWLINSYRFLCILKLNPCFFLYFLVNNARTQMAVNLFLKQLTSMDITTAKATEKCSIFLKDTEKWIFWQKLLLYLQKEKKKTNKKPLKHGEKRSVLS